MASISVTNIQIGSNDTVHFYDGSTIIQSVSQIAPNATPYILRDGLNIVIINRNPGNDFQLKDGSRANDHLVFNTMYVLNVGARSYTPISQALQNSGDLNLQRAREIYSDLVNNIFKGCCDCSENGGCNIQYQYDSGLETGQFYTISGKLLMSMDSFNGTDFSDLLSEFPNGSWLWFTKDSDPNSFFIYEISNYIVISGLAVWDYVLIDSKGVISNSDIFCLDIKPAIGGGGGGSGTVTSVGLTMPSAFNVSGSPITNSGTLAVAAAGLSSQYIKGDGTLANFPTSIGGGASVNYYLNGSVNQGVFGGDTYYEMNRVPIIGSGTNFTIATNGYIAQFITDANDPFQLNIPAGNWNFEMYFQASSTGGSPSFYVELYKWDGATFTLIASSSANPEGITNGTTIDLYLTALAVPATTLALTDRLAVRVYVNNSGRTITLHTEDNNLCQVITTFTTGLTALNGLTAQVQNLAVGTSGTDFNISSVTATHTFNLPTASATNRGALSSADWTTFNDKAPTNSPAFTSVPTAPTAASGTSTTQIATTAFVQNAVAQSASPESTFGDGSDGNVTVTGPISLTSDMYYNDLTISGAGSINMAGYRVFVTGNLDLSNAGASALHANGTSGINNGTSAAAAGQRGGVGVTSPGWGTAESGVALGGTSGAGGTSPTGNGANGSAPTSIGANTRHTSGGPGGAGGAGGAATGTGGTGGAAQSTSTSPVANVIRTFIHAARNLDFTRYTINSSSGGAYVAVNTCGGRHGGGGAGGGASTGNGKSGGSGGGGGGIAVIYARQITVGASTNSAAISALGGNGGAGGTSAFNSGGGGGGGAGGGGYVYLVFGSVTGGSYTFVSAAGGTGGTGSDGTGPGAIGGTGGTGGSGGRITAINLSTGDMTHVDGTGNAASAPVTATTSTGTAGTVGGTCTFSS